MSSDGVESQYEIPLQELLLNLPMIVDALSLSSVLTDENIRRLERAITDPDPTNYKLCLRAKELIFKISCTDDRIHSIQGAMVGFQLFGGTARQLVDIVEHFQSTRIAYNRDLTRIGRELIKRSPLVVRRDTREDRERRYILQQAFLTWRRIEEESAEQESARQGSLPLTGRGMCKDGTPPTKPTWLSEERKPGCGVEGA